ncbi:MAG: hypothetical protein V1915_04750 [Candidatus Bathyarchaeota archaeon]
MTSIKIRRDMVKTSIPKALYMSIVKIQAVENLTFDEACFRCSERLEKNSVEYKRAVEFEAESRYKSRHMTEFNKAKETIARQNQKTGYEAGYKAAKAQYEIWYYCSVCGEKITINHDSNVHKAVIELLREKGWAHTACHKKKK